MKFKGLPISVSASILIGIAHGAFFLVCLGYITAYEPWSMWLIDHGLTGRTLHVVLIPLGVLIAVALCLPGAWGICKLRPKKRILYTAFAFLPLMLWENRFFIFEPEKFTLFVPWFEILPLALAVILVSRLTNRSSSLRQQAGSTGRGSATPLN